MRALLFRTHLAGVSLRIGSFCNTALAVFDASNLYLAILRPRQATFYAHSTSSTRICCALHAHTHHRFHPNLTLYFSQAHIRTIIQSINKHLPTTYLHISSPLPQLQHHTFA